MVDENGQGVALFPDPGTAYAKRRDVAAELLNSPCDTLHLTARKVKWIWTVQLALLVASAGKEICMTLLAPFRLLVRLWRADNMSVEGYSLGLSPRGCYVFGHALK